LRTPVVFGGRRQQSLLAKGVGKTPTFLRKGIDFKRELERWSVKGTAYGRENAKKKIGGDGFWEADEEASNWWVLNRYGRAELAAAEGNFS